MKGPDATGWLHLSYIRRPGRAEINTGEARLSLQLGKNDPTGLAAGKKRQEAFTFLITLGLD